MRKSQIIAIIIAIVVIVIFFSLPKVIINESNKDKLAVSPKEQSVLSTIPSDSRTISEKDFNIIKNSRKNFYEVTDIKKRYIFADSLASMFLTYLKFDSVAKYADELVLLIPGTKSRKTAGDYYFAAYSAIKDPSIANSYGTKARLYYTEVVKATPSDFQTKNKMAMTYVTTENPMQAIMILREILNKDPQNQDAMFNIGLLSIQSGQFEKAIERFRNVIKLAPSNWAAHLYLGISLKETGKSIEAKKEFDLVIQNSKDLALIKEAKQLSN